METETSASTSTWTHHRSRQFWWSRLFKNRNLTLACQSLGVVYGDLSVSPLYVYSSTFKWKLQNHQNEDAVFGVFSLIFWTFTLIPLIKYVLILLTADDNGEGGTFALYSLLCRHTNLSLIPNRQAEDEELSAYNYGPPTTNTTASSLLKGVLEKHEKLRIALLLVVLFGACMVIGDGVFTPAISVLSASSGLQYNGGKLNNEEVLFLACVILVCLFALQHYGTHKVAFLFAPIVIIWLVSIFIIGLYNTLYWNPMVFAALSPTYIVKFFRQTGKEGWISLGGILLSITGSEAMFADLGHFTASSIRLAFVFTIYPCLVVQYMGQAAFLSKNLSSLTQSFYPSIPDRIYWPMFVIATLAAIVGSQAVITATFSIIKQCHALGCFPRIKIIHTSRHIYGQIYIPEINWILMILCLAITIGFKDTTLIGNAYGIACMSVMFITTFLMALVIIFVWKRSIILAAAFLLFFWFIEGIYLSSAFIKVSQGGWVPLVLSTIFMAIMYVWHYGTRQKYEFELHNKVSMNWLLNLSGCLGLARVPGIGLVYSDLATGVPAIFTHFITNFPTFHEVLIFVCVKSVPVPYVSTEERFLVGRICPTPYKMYRCIVRYGYKDIQQDNGDSFENQIIQSIAEFIRMEEQFSSTSEISESSHLDERVAIISTRATPLSLTWIDTDLEVDTIQSSTTSVLNTSSSIRLAYEEENPSIRRRQVRLQLESNPSMSPSMREELMDLIQAKAAGITYIMGHSYVKAHKSSSFLKKLAIDMGYSVLRQNCRDSTWALDIPHIGLIQVGMIYYV
ncbi:potassium transporter 4-like [Macadamia integrifolia]|uniref:potassium transporter 4-like n=1 Tax=Macadamia integrifolia TaxID=60698 RepID=UPI001C4FB9F3|nr:potassium transporter 4-like [Macadamia integrifolia]